MARDIVADMMASLKVILSKQTHLKINQNNHNRRMMQYSDTTTMSDDNEQNYVNVRTKIHRKDILNALRKFDITF